MRAIALEGVSPLHGRPMRVTLSARRDDAGDYRVRVWDSGQRITDADYFTNDWQDAVDTARHITGHQTDPLATRDERRPERRRHP